MVQHTQPKVIKRIESIISELEEIENIVADNHVCEIDIAIRNLLCVTEQNEV